MLEHIARFINEGDILALRQTSRTVDSKVFNVFADTFLSSRDCFVLDPKRLRNLKAIVSSPSMVRRLRSLTLTVHPLPVEPSMIQLAARKDQDHCMDQLDEFELLCDRMYERYYNFMDKPLVVSILRTLKTTGSCTLVLDLTSYRGCMRAGPRMVETVYHDLYHAVVYEAGHEIEFIEMDDHLGVEVATARTTELPSLQSLSGLSLCLRTGFCEDSARRPYVLPCTRNFGACQELLRSTAKLQYLELTDMSTAIMRYSQQTLQADMVNFATVLLVRPLVHLQTLNLFGVNLFERTLSTVLSYCAPTIAQLNFEDVLLNSTSWQNIFLQLRSTCHRLDHLRLRQVSASAVHGGFQLMFGARRRSALTEVMWESCEYEFLTEGHQGEYSEAMHDAMIVKTPTSVHNTLALLAYQGCNYVGPLFC
ncbi:hypothetical protein Slin14017_G055370 [Septoria linicola]|nr:hypothetical protein Slin14017_G055370 [Septoria linicola]